jgi:DNA-binding PadR family transcriptional regulator
MPRAKLTDRDLELLSFASEHRLVLAAHVQALLRTSAAGAYRRLHALTAAGFLRQRVVFHQQPGCYQITSKGLAAIGSRYGPPRFDLSCYQHDIGLAWLWLLAQRGRFGPMREVISERCLRSVDAARDRTAEPMGVRLGGFGAGGRERLHYPDLLMVAPSGHRIAVELELSPKGRARRDRILTGYAIDARIEAVLYLVDQPAIGRAVHTSAARAGISDRVYVKPMRWGTGAGVSATERAPTRARRDPELVR